MKLTILLLTAAFLNVHANSTAQTVTLSGKDMTLKQVFAAIEKQTGYVVFNKKGFLSDSKLVSLTVYDMPLAELLQAVLKDQPVNFVIEGRNIIISRKSPVVHNSPLVVVSSDQQLTFLPITGTVRGPDGQLLVGATVRVKGKDISTVTDDKGSFSLNAEVGSILVISYTGFESKEILVISNTANLNISLEPDIKALKEVLVSTGYQELPIERATGAFTILSNTLFNRSVSTDILSRLDGVTNSVLFDKRSGTQNFSIRGRSTIYANSSPLIVVDNFPYEGDIKNINPNDVDNVTILKDAAAASIWGVRAANGVVVITTKKGRFTQPMKISFNSNLTIENRPDIFSVSAISSSDFIDVEQFLFGKGFYTSLESSASHPPLTPVVELLIKKRDGILSAGDADAQINALRNVDVRNDFRDYLYEKGIKQQYGLTIQGGNSDANYLLSVGYDHAKDNLDAIYRRFNLRSINTIKLWKGLEASFGVSYTKSAGIPGKPSYNNITSGGGRGLYPYARLADDNGTALSIVRDYRSVFVQQAKSKGLMDWEYKPLIDYQLQDNITNLQDFLINAGLSYHFLNGFSIDLKYQYENAMTDNNNLQGLGTYNTRDIINRYTQVAANGSLTYPVPVGAILDINNTSLRNQNIRGQINYANSFGQHRINAIAGAEIREIATEGSTSRVYGYNDDLLTTTTVDYLTSFTQYNNSGSKIQIPENRSFSGIVNRYVSSYSNLAYTFKNKYSLSLSGRKDGSNLFGVNTNQKFVPLWSAGLAWDIGKETFYKVDWLPALKLRATYGYNGNVDNSRSAYTTISYSPASFNLYIPTPYAAISALPNPDLRWEQVGIMNLGLDFSFKNKRISGSIDWYQKKGKDLMGDVPVDQTVGQTTGKIRKNVADMKSNGIDLELNTKNIEGSFVWATTFLSSFNTNRITKYDSITSTGSSYINSGTSIVPLIGKPVYSIFSYAWAGIDPKTGDPLGIYNGGVSKDYVNMNGKTKVADLVFSGSAVPTLFGSIRNSFDYKRFSLSVNIVYRIGYWFKRPSINYSGLFTNWRATKDFADRWQKPGDESVTNVPSLIYPINTARETFYTNSSILVEKGDNIRLQDIQAAYNFNKKQLKGLPFANLQVYLYANNLGFLWRANKYGLDPDYLTVLPAPKSFSIGVRAEFK